MRVVAICFGGKWGEFLVVPSSRFTNGRLDSSNLLIAAGTVCALKNQIFFGRLPMYIDQMSNSSVCVATLVIDSLLVN